MLETWMVVDRRSSPHGLRILREFIADVGIEVELFTQRHATLAREARRRYGKGSGHRAGLYFGDCCAYALAREANEPILFIGNDFVHTDVEPAVSW